MFRDYELKKGVETEKFLFELSQKINEFWKAHPAKPKAFVKAHLIVFPNCFIGIDDKTNEILVGFHLGTSCEIVAGVVTALFEFRDRLKTMDVPLYYHKGELIFGAEAFVKCGADLIDFRKVAQSLEDEAFARFAKQKKH